MWVIVSRPDRRMKQRKRSSKGLEDENKYGCTDRGALSFINSRQLIDLLLTAQQTYSGDLGAAVEHSNFSTASKQKLYAALDDLARRGYVLVNS